MPGNPVFRVFVSSTFRDFAGERDVLRERVWPELERYCRAHGAHFKAIDLRWGVSEADGRRQETMRICLDEVRRCKALTPRPNFLTLIGDRYGWAPPPDDVPEAVFEAARGRLTAGSAGRRILEAWYGLDRNAVDPATGSAVWRLLPEDEVDRSVVALSGAEAEAGWEAIREAFEEALSGEDALTRARYLGSATEREIVEGVLGEPGPADHALVWERSLANPEADTTGVFRDAAAGGAGRSEQAALEALKAQLQDRVPAAHHLEGEATLEPGPAGPQPSASYLARFAEAVTTGLKALIAEQIRDSERSEQAYHPLGGQEIPLVGRSGWLDRLAAHCRSGSGRPGFLTGAGGMGKSTLMRGLAERVRDEAGPIVEALYIGAEPGLTTGRALFERIHRILDERWEPTAEAPEGLTTSELGALLRERLAEAPEDAPALVLLVDALDQLPEGDAARRLGWLPDRTAPEARVLIALRAGLPDLDDALEARSSDWPIWSLDGWGEKEGKAFLQRWLRGRQRRLGEAQQRQVLAGFLADGGRPLYLRLACEWASRWRSWDEPGPLPVDVHGLINLWLETLEDRHGAALVAASLGLLAASREGLSEQELVELLYQRPEVLEEYRRTFPYSPDLDAPQLPDMLWARLYRDLGPFLAEAHAGDTWVYRFFHRELWEAADLRYGEPNKPDPKPSLPWVQTLANYFKQQPLFIGPVANGERLGPNRRRVVEELSAEREIGQTSRLKELLTDFDFLKSTASLPEEAWLEEVQETLKEGGQDDSSLDPWLRFLWRARLSLRQAPESARDLGALEPEGTEVRDQAVAELDSAKEPRFVPLPDEDARGLQGFEHGARITDATFHPDGRALATIGEDGWLRVWDLDRGGLEKAFPAHAGQTPRVRWSPSEPRLLATYDAHTVRVWDLDASTVVYDATLEEAEFRQVEWCPKQAYLVAFVSGEDDHSSWDEDPATGEAYWDEFKIDWGYLLKMGPGKDGGWCWQELAPNSCGGKGSFEWLQGSERLVFSCSTSRESHFPPIVALVDLSQEAMGGEESWTEGLVWAHPPFWSPPSGEGIFHYGIKCKDNDPSEPCTSTGEILFSAFDSPTGNLHQVDSETFRDWDREMAGAVLTARKNGRSSPLCLGAAERPGGEGLGRVLLLELEGQKVQIHDWERYRACTEVERLFLRPGKLFAYLPNGVSCAQANLDAPPFNLSGKVFEESGSQAEKGRATRRFSLPPSPEGRFVPYYRRFSHSLSTREYLAELTDDQPELMAMQPDTSGMFGLGDPEVSTLIAVRDSDQVMDFPYAPGAWNPDGSFYLVGGFREVREQAGEGRQLVRERKVVAVWPANKTYKEGGVVRNIKPSELGGAGRGLMPRKVNWSSLFSTDREVCPMPWGWEFLFYDSCQKKIFLGRLDKEGNFSGESLLGETEYGVSDMDVSPDGETLGVAEETGKFIWFHGEGFRKTTILTAAGAGTPVSFKALPDGKHWVAGTPSGKFFIFGWDEQEGQMAWKKEGHFGRTIRDLGVSGSGHYLIAGTSEGPLSFKIENLALGTPVKTMIRRFDLGHGSWSDRLVVDCPGCGKDFDGEKEKAGDSVACPECDQQILLNTFTVDALGR